jgi:hypothetical protein
VVRVKRSGREQVGQVGCWMLCAPTGRIKSLNANMLQPAPKISVRIGEMTSDG